MEIGNLAPFIPNNAKVCVGDDVVFAIAPEVYDLLVLVMSLEWFIGLGRVDEIGDAMHTTWYTRRGG